MSAQEMLAWIGANVTRDEHDTQTALQKACWFVAYTSAQQLQDLTTKELARALADGMEPIQTEAHVQDWLNTIFYEDIDTEEAHEQWEWLVDTMRAFWRVGR